MKTMTDTMRLTVSALTLAIAGPAVAQDDAVIILSNWNYDTLYEDGWSVENMFDSTEVIDANGEPIGDIENVIFSDEGKLLGIIAEVGGFWDIGDTHIQVPWEQIENSDSIAQLTVPVTEETVDQYDVFGDYWMEEDTITSPETVGPVNDDLVAGPNVFKATDLIGDYVVLSDGGRYGYVADIVVVDGAISAIVTDAAAYGRPGYYAYPYTYRGVSPDAGTRYTLPYPPAELQIIDNFDYDRLQSRTD